MLKIVFVGESPPLRGNQFHEGPTVLSTYMMTVFTDVFDVVYSSYGGFLKWFEKNGLRLIDLCEQPISHLSKPEKRKWRINCTPGLARRLYQLRPECVVSLMQTIGPHVFEAFERSGIPADFYCLHFPSYGNQVKFVHGLTKLLKTHWRIESNHPPDRRRHQRKRSSFILTRRK